MDSHVIAVIPARGGSKGVPRKNIKLLRGVPVIAYSIESARNSPSIERVIVSTDDAKIGEISRSYGAEVIWRPDEISGDTASSEAALLHALDYLRDTEAYNPDLVVFLQATSPLRQYEDIQNAIDKLVKEKADSLFSACSTHGFIWRKQGSELSSLTYDYFKRPRRQDIGEDLIENGSIYIFKPWVLREFNNRLGGVIGVYKMSPLDSFQIDAEEDFILIEKLIELRYSRLGPKKLKEIRMLVLDFDGVMTDNRVLLSQDGVESVFCHRGDGQGVENLVKVGVSVVVISKESSPVVAARCRKLGISCFQNAGDKLAMLKQIVKEHDVELDRVVYVGNDINDIVCIKAAGVGVAVADACPEVRASADIVTQAFGGKGAVREICDLILESMNHNDGG